MRSPLQVLSIASTLLVAIAAPALASSDLIAQGMAGATSLDMEGMGSASVHIVKLAEVSVSTDSASGFTLSVSSGNITKSDSRTPIQFQVVLVDRGASAPSSAAFTTPSGMTYTFATVNTVAIDKDLYIRYQPASLQDPGSYSAIVDLGVADN